MLRGLELSGVGPASRLRVDLGPRLSVFAGESGLGKSFVLEVLWWALSGTWAELPVWPRAEPGAAPEIAVAIDAALADAMQMTARRDVRLEGDAARVGSRFDVEQQDWPPLAIHFAERPLPALVMLARGDGSFAVWDPARNHHTVRPRGRIGLMDTEVAASPALLRRPPAYVFAPRAVWDGLEAHGKTLCNGLVRDWVLWQERRARAGAASQPFALLRSVLEALSAHPDRAGEILRPGRPARVFADDTRDFPTVDLGYGDVPVLHASAGVRRILSLAYLLVWSWHEHLTASRLLGRPPVQQVVCLVDDVERHLHPGWQRRIVPALLDVLHGLAPGMRAQVCVTTHAPLVLASLEPGFDPARDRFSVFELDAGRVRLHTPAWTKRGDAVDWLTSPAFKLGKARSLEAERALEDAEAFLAGKEPVRYKTRAELDAELRRVLAEDDVFWPRWLGDREGSPA